MYNWSLTESQFTFYDRLQICSFFLNTKNKWTQDKYVREYEQKIADYTGAKYAVVVTNGSVANQLFAQYVKDGLVKSGEWIKRNKVIVASVSWATNISPFIREGFEPVFIDVSLHDFCISYGLLEDYLKKNHETIACVFPTSLLGFTPDINYLGTLQKQYPSIKFGIDFCENLLGSYNKILESGNKINDVNVCCINDFTTTTSGFFSHHTSSGSEFGVIFCQNENEYQYYLMARAHGLVRNLIPYSFNLSEDLYDYKCYDHLHNQLVDFQFDFNLVSSNYRSTDINAFCALLDLKRLDFYKKKRVELYDVYRKSLNSSYYLPKDRSDYYDVAFCLPIILKYPDVEKINKIKEILDELKIERRPFVSGSQLRQTAFKQYGNYKDYPVAEHLNDFGMYVGLHPSLNKSNIITLTNALNSI